METYNNNVHNILFRGFHADKNGKYTILLNNERITGDWLYGSLLRFGKNNFIIPNEAATADEVEICFSWDLIKANYGVIPETVGQYIGLRDSSRTKDYPEGQMIFAGDICSFVDFFSGSDNETYCEGVWEFAEGYFYISDRLSSEMTDLVYNGRFEGYVLGNVFSTPEDFKGASFFEEYIPEDNKGEV